jgi:hypothetical protein
MTDWNPSPAKGMIRRGFLDPRIASPSLPLAIVSLASSVQADKNPAPTKGLICRGFLGLSTASPSTQGSKVDIEEPQVCSIVSTSFGATELGLSLSQSYPCMTGGGAPIYSSVSKSQLGYSRRVKDKLAKQLHKNNELLNEVVVETSVEGVEGYSKGVLDAVKFTPNVGLSWGGDEKSLLDLLSVI